MNRCALFLPQRHHSGNCKHGFSHLFLFADAQHEPVLQREKG